MPRILVPKEHWGEVWKALVEVGAVSLISDEPIYIVSKKHIGTLFGNLLKEDRNGRSSTQRIII